MILTAAQQRALTKAQGLANEVLPTLEWLEAVAEVYPPIAERVKQARDQRNMLQRVAEVGLEMDRVLSQQ